MSEQLKPCPFCGSTNLDTRDARDFITCRDCGAEGPYQPGVAGHAWNTRANEQQRQDCPPVLVRDLAEILGRAVPDVMSAFIVAGLAPHSPNMAVSGEDALAVAAVLKTQRQDCEPWGWAIVDKNGDDIKKRVRQINFFGAVNHQQEPLTQDDVAQADRDWPGLAPCRLVTLYAAPPKREPLSREEIRHLMYEAGYVDATPQEKADFINGARLAEKAHGIGVQS